ncbi:MAG: relaxase/mobilization nuclease domain-containing protein [Oscillospiraceae bacterium]|nr:relaxase/mobilization nuclease domain-containing protein [Oscillospiraceae bacterium]
MPYIKCISVRNSVKGCLKYIANPDKTEGQFYLSGVNCSENISIAEKEFCLTYQNYSHKDFYATPTDNSKSSVKAFHIIQSFAKDECDAGVAHKIGLEWVQKAFGDNFQAVVATHTDRDCVHNHICLCPYDLDGKKFNSNKRSLENIRRVSDEICRAYEINKMERIMAEENHARVGVSYGEWIHRKRGTSWKEIIRSKINLLVKTVPDFASLLEELERQGCTVKRGKYISVKLPEQQRFVRLKTLGTDYTEGNLRRRIREYIELFPRVKTVAEIIAEVMGQFDFQTRKFSFAKSVQNTTAMLANQLNIVNGDGLISVSMVKDKLSEVEKLAEETQLQLDYLEDKKKSAEEVISAAERYFKKYGMFEKSKQYPKASQKADKELLDRFGVKSADDVEKLRTDIEKYSYEISVLQTSVDEIRNRIDDYKSILEACSGEDYISRLVRLAREKMDEQEKIKLKKLEKETYEVYYPCSGKSLVYDDLERIPNIDDYFKDIEGSWFDVEGESVGDKLENICRSRSNIGVGAVIVINGQKAYFVDRTMFKAVPDFMRSRAEQIRVEQEKTKQKEKRSAVRKTRGR